MIISLLLVIIGLLALQCWQTYYATKHRSSSTKPISGGVIYDHAGRRDNITSIEDDE